MKSKAAIGNHPIHPMPVPIPIGPFALALLGDVLHTVRPEDSLKLAYEHRVGVIGPPEIHPADARKARAAS